MGRWVLGLDGCKGGWAGVGWSDAGLILPVFGATVDAVLATVEEAVDAESLEVLAIDIPIGMSEHPPRQADALARKRLGAAGSSVFATPSRHVLEAPTYAEARAIAGRLGQPGVSAQAYALGTKILEVDTWLRTSSILRRLRVVEVHPEVSFREMGLGRPLPSKRTWRGYNERRRLLADGGLAIPDELGMLGDVAGLDDVLDAAAAAWTARRVLLGQARSLPDPPEELAGPLAAAIWV